MTVEAEVASLLASAPFDKYAPEFLMIEDERGALVPFRLNDAQKIISAECNRLQAKGSPIKLLVLKGRQQGVSTFCQMFLFWRCHTRPGTRALTVGHVLPAVHDLYRKFERAWKGLAEHSIQRAGILIQPQIEPGGERGRRMTFADPVRSSYRADSATEPDGIGRGGTFNLIHATEIPQWSKPEETMQAMLAAVPDHPDTAIFIETTAKGASGWFFEAWTNAIRQQKQGIEPEFVPVFIPWFKTDRYRRKRRQGEPTLNKREIAQRDKYDLCNEQLYWYRDQEQRYGDRAAEEFPYTWEEAFRSSGAPFFRNEDVEFYRLKSRERSPLRKGCFRISKAGKIRAKFVDEDFGPTHIFEEPVPEHRYSMGVDFSTGRAKDFGTIVIIDVDAKKVVCVHQSKFLPDDLLAEAVLLARIYNEAFIVPERNSLGQVLVDRLTGEWGYLNVYRHADPTSVKHRHGANYGFVTSTRTRPGLLEEAAHKVHTRALEIPDPRIIEEMQTFVFVTDDGTRAAAAPGCNDDLVLGFAMAVHGMNSVPTRISFKRTNKAAVSAVTGY